VNYGSGRMRNKAAMTYVDLQHKITRKEYPLSDPHDSSVTYRSRNERYFRVEVLREVFNIRNTCLQFASEE
jgi:hypothetical protein